MELETRPRQPRAQDVRRRVEREDSESESSPEIRREIPHRRQAASPTQRREQQELQTHTTSYKRIDREIFWVPLVWLSSLLCCTLIGILVMGILMTRH